MSYFGQIVENGTTCKYSCTNAPMHSPILGGRVACETDGTVYTCSDLCAPLYTWTTGNHTDRWARRATATPPVKHVHCPVASTHRRAAVTDVIRILTL